MKSSKVRNYEISKNYKRELNEVARIKRLSVAVLVDGIRTPDGDGGEVFEPRSQQELERLAALVRSSVGFDEDRGDKVVLDSMSFSPEAIAGDDSGPPMGVWDYFNMLWRPVSALLFLILLIGVMRATRRLTDGATEILDSPKSVRELEAALGEGAGAALAGLDGEHPGAARSSPAPDKAAAVIKGWLAGG
jgi:flagellar M-ring protein FliF